MCPEDDAHLTLEFSDHYVIIPSITFDISKKMYTTNKLGQKGKFVPNGFSYTSQNNKKFLDINEIKKLIKKNYDE